MGNARGRLAYLVDLDDDDEDAELIFFVRRRPRIRAVRAAR